MTVNYDYLFWLIVFAQFADILTTDDALALGAREAGPVKWLFGAAAKIGLDPIDVIMVVKYWLLCLIAWLHNGGQIEDWAYWAILVGYVAVLASNVYQESRQKDINNKKR